MYQSMMFVLHIEVNSFHGKYESSKDVIFSVLISQLIISVAIDMESWEILLKHFVRKKQK